MLSWLIQGNIFCLLLNFWETLDSDDNSLSIIIIWDPLKFVGFEDQTITQLVILGQYQLPGFLKFES